MRTHLDQPQTTYLRNPICSTHCCLAFCALFCLLFEAIFSPAKKLLSYKYVVNLAFVFTHGSVLTARILCKELDLISELRDNVIPLIILCKFNH